MTAQTLTQNTRVVATEKGALWVESTAQSTCSGCRAKSGCGQHWLSKLSGKQAFMRIPMGQSGDYKVGDRVMLTIPANAVVLGSLIAYGLPLLSVIVSLLAFKPWLTQEWMAIVVAIVALIIGSLIAYLWSNRTKRKSYFLPSVTRLLPSNET